MTTFQLFHNLVAFTYACQNSIQVFASSQQQQCFFAVKILRWKMKYGIKSYKLFDKYQRIRILFDFDRKTTYFYDALTTNQHQKQIQNCCNAKWFHSCLSCCFSWTLSFELPSKHLIFYSQAKYFDQKIVWLNFFPFASYKFSKTA